MEKKNDFDLATLLVAVRQAGEFTMSADRLVFGDGRYEPYWEHQWSRSSSRKAFLSFARRRTKLEATRIEPRSDGAWDWVVDFAPHGVFSVSYYIAIPFTPAEHLAKREVSELQRHIGIASASARATGRL